jgi:hypothetical protein
MKNQILWLVGFYIISKILYITRAGLSMGGIDNSVKIVFSYANSTINILFNFIAILLAIQIFKIVKNSDIVRIFKEYIVNNSSRRFDNNFRDKD